MLYYIIIIYIVYWAIFASEKNFVKFLFSSIFSQKDLPFCYPPPILSLFCLPATLRCLLFFSP